MSRATNRLTDRGVKGIKATGRHADGSGLYLVITPTGTRNWSMFYQWEGKRREMGLGSAAASGGLSLADARSAALKVRIAVGDGLDPITNRAAILSGSEAPVLKDFASTYIDTMKPRWTGRLTEDAWRRSFNLYAKALGEKKVDAIQTSDVLTVLKPIWSKHPETARQVRQRLEVVLDAAKAQGFREGENPARWRGHLSHMLPKQVKLIRGHHPAVAYQELAVVMGQLRARRGVSARALEFIVLTVSRASMVLEARWGEFDLAKKLWVGPAARMKMRLEHRVPLSDEAVAVLQKMHPDVFKKSDLVFPGRIKGRPLHLSTVERLLGSITPMGVPHGFRSTFKDWGGDLTDHPRELIEEALAHAVGDATERAYRRTTAVEKRRKVMEDWGKFTGG